MKLAGSVCAFVCIFGMTTMFARSAPTEPPGPAVTASPADAMPCPTAPPDDLGTAFGYDLNDAVLLRFISALATLSGRRQRTVFAAVSAAAASPPADVVTALASVCPSLDARIATTRGLAYVVNEWDVPELEDGKRYAELVTILSRATTALSARSTVPAGIVEAATAPFRDVAATAPAAAPNATLRAGTPCNDVPARILHVVPPGYPPLAARAGVTGIVRVKVRLDEAGDVRSAGLLTTTAGNAPGAADLVRHAVYSAAASTYAPETLHCVPIGGVYEFTANFDRSR